MINSNAPLESASTTASPQPLSPETLAQLRAVSTFSSLKDEDLACIAQLEEIHLSEGDILVRQGEVAQFFFILLEGTLSLFQSGPNGRDLMIGSAAPGSTFGEVPLLANMPNTVNIRATSAAHLVRLDEEQFWDLMTSCPEVRKAILGNMAVRFQRYQSIMVQQEKMASLGTLAAGLMHELNNPGAAARRAASQLRQNIQRLHQISSKFSRTPLTTSQKECLFELQEHAMTMISPLRMNSLEQSDAEEELATWMESASIPDAWKLAPTLVSIGIDAEDLECARNEFPGEVFTDALCWLDALVSSQQLVGMIEESIGRVSDLVHAVKLYAYEGKGTRQTLDVNDSVHATLVILGHKIREKQIVLDKEFGTDLPLVESQATGLNQVWTNILDNAIDAVRPGGTIQIRTFARTWGDAPDLHTDVCVSITDDGPGIPLESQPHIFDPFYTTKEVGVGTGLGLGIVSRIVEQFGGAIRFSSIPGATKFQICIPTAHT